jgi:hypothetical protein
MASAQYCDPGAYITACSAVLVICADEPSWCADVRSTLQSTGAFAAVDTFDARSASSGGSGTPSALQLAGYHAVFVYNNHLFADSVLLGDVLAAYHDQGGGVVVGTDFYSGFLEGAYGAVASGYALLDYAQGSEISSDDSLGDVLEPQSPLMYGVTSLSASIAYRSNAPVVAGRAVVVARWGGGEPLVLRGMRGQRTLVELNFWPVSSSKNANWWLGDGAALLRNGLKYSRCMPCEAGTYAMAGDGRGGGVFAETGNLRVRTS